MKTERVVFESGGQKLCGILHLPDRRKPACVVASHGLLSSKDSEKYVGLGERLAAEGIAMLRFDFRGIGESEGHLEDDTVTRRITDLGAAIGLVRSRPEVGNRVGLVGSSLGGYVSLFKAASDQEIRPLVIWATPFHLGDLKSKERKDNTPLPAGPFFEDLPKHRLGPVLPKISRCLVIHGESDETVPVDQAWEIFQGLAAPKEIHTIEGADHRLTDPGHRKRALSLTVDWFKKYLTG